MYPVSTQQNAFSQESLEFVLSKSISKVEPGDAGSLRRIADLSYDLLSRISKSEKLRRMGQLGQKGEAEFDSNVRLVGLMIHLLQQYGYNDAEMMASLEKKYRQLAPGIYGKEA